MTTKKKSNDQNGYEVGRTPKQARILHGVYGKMKVIDAKDNLRVFVNSDDIEGAKRNNICECVYARACRRLFGSRAVVFFKRTAYVDLPDENGVRQINRFTLGLGVSARIIEFDKTGKAAPGGFLLNAPARSNTLESRSAQASKNRKQPGAKKKADEAHARHKRRRHAIIIGQITPAELHAEEGYVAHKEAAGPIGYVRNGSGMAHFTTKEKRKRAA